MSALRLRSSLVALVTAVWAAVALRLFSSPRASTIWLFQSGMVFTREDWIFSTMRVSLFWSIRVWGPI